MELKLERHDNAPYPACGFFVEGDELMDWIGAIDRLGLYPADLKIYGLPSRRANKVWGCLILTASAPSTAQLGPLASAHLAAGRLVVPEKSRVVPELTDYDLERLFREDTYVLHPDFGLFKLTEPLNLRDSFRLEKVSILESSRPAEYSVASGEILAFQVTPSPPEEIERGLDSGVTREKLKDAPLSLAEKLRLKLYESFMTTEGGKPILNLRGDKLQRLAAKLGMSGPDAYKELLEDFQNLEERNKKEVDKLLGLLEKDPEAALRYAIPLDEHGYSRGGAAGAFKLEDRGRAFSLFGGRGGGAGGSVNLGNEFFRLQEHYQNAARELQAAGKFEKAAYVYLKLLKDYNSAAETLRQSKHYEKAAAVYLRYLKDERAAAECYEMGSIYDEAIPLYTKLEEWEKVGDLHVLRGDGPSARSAYQRQLEKELDKKAFVRAAKLSKEKMKNLPHAQELLLRGWDQNVDAYNCLQYYLANISTGKTAWMEIQNIRNHRLNTGNDQIFLKILGNEYSQQHEHRKEVKKMAYGLLSELLTAGRISAHELLAFDKNNIRLRADTLRYELSKNRRKRK